MNKLPNEITNYITNKYVLIFGQWFLAFLIGNIFGLPIMKILYKTLIPSGKYSHYNTSTHKSVYVDDVESFISENEVQIGKNANNGKKRAIIEKIYKVTKIVVLIQIVLSILFFVLFKQNKWRLNMNIFEKIKEFLFRNNKTQLIEEKKRRN